MDWELVIVSNGKSQATQLDVIKKFAQNDERVKVDALFCLGFIRFTQRMAIVLMGGYLTFSRKKVHFLFSRNVKRLVG